MSVGVRSIDAQHQTFISIINELEMIVDPEKKEFVTGLTLNEIETYSTYHFMTEEKYFALFDYELAKEHVEEHRKMTGQIKEFRRRFFEERQDVSAELMAFCQDWLNDHLMKQDKKYTKCFNEHGLR